MAAPVPARAMAATDAFRRDPALWRLNFKKKSRRRFLCALGASLLFHLSMITLFEIGIVFPREDIRYYQVQIVSAPEAPPETRLDPASPDTLTLGGYESLPAVELPVVEFAEMERLRIRYDASAPFQEVSDLIERPAGMDSWARFNTELQRLSRSLRDLALPGEPSESGDKPDSPSLVHRPAEGFEAYIEWSGPPRDRSLLFAPPMKVLWNTPPAELRRPLEIVFKVDAGGRVVNVWSPVVEESELVDEVQMTVLQYRFSPLAEHEIAGEGKPSSMLPAEQSGVLFIRAAGEPR